MVAEAEVVCQQSVPVLDVQYFAKGNEIEDVVNISPRRLNQIRVSDSVPADLSTCQVVSSPPFFLVDSLDCLSCFLPKGLLCELQIKIVTI